jgi:hypothetical protein
MLFLVSMIFDVRMMQLSSAMGRLCNKLVFMVFSTITNFDVLWRFRLKPFRLAQLFFVLNDLDTDSSQFNKPSDQPSVPRAASDP